MIDDLERMPQLPPGGRLAGRVAIVTGAGSPSSDIIGVGIGAATARLLARDGCRVVVADIDPTAGARTIALIEGEGGQAIAAQADLTVDADCQRVVGTAVETFGSLDILVNNLGIDGHGRIDEITDTQWERVMSVNVKSVMLMTRHVIPLLQAGGAVVNISSISSFRPMYDRVDYSASKGAVNSLTLALAVQHGRDNIRVNGICPGTPWTAMSARGLAGKTVEEIAAVRRQRLDVLLLPVEGTAWDIAETAAFLVSDQARWITGQIVTVDGGTTLRPHWGDLGRRPSAQKVEDRESHGLPPNSMHNV